MNLKKTLAKLKKVTWPNYEGKPTHPDAFIKDGFVCVSAESGDGAADYYEYSIHPALEKFADSNNAYWEWENPGCIMLCAA